MWLIVRVGQLVCQLVDSELNEILSPLADGVLEVDLFCMLSERVDDRPFIDVGFVYFEPFQNRSDLVVVVEPITVEKVENDGRIECCPFVPVDEGMVRHEQPQQVKRFLVNRLWTPSETPVADAEGVRDLTVGVHDDQPIPGPGERLFAGDARTRHFEEDDLETAWIWLV